MKGLPIAAIPQRGQVQVWFSSPTGDSSDSHTYDIVCASHQQATTIAQAYNELIQMWESKQDNINYEAEQLKIEADQLRRRLRDAESKVASLTATLIRHYKDEKSWFDQTVSI
jgi:hypothetical protein